MQIQQQVTTPKSSTDTHKCRRNTCVIASAFATLMMFSVSLWAVNSPEPLTQEMSELPECNTPSERLELLGNDYYHIETPVKHQRVEIEALDKFYDALEGTGWTGTMVDAVCLGNRDTQRVEKHHYAIEWLDNEITFKGTLRMRMERVRLDIRHGKSRAVSLTQTKDDFLKASDLLSIEQLDENTIRLNRRYRQAQNDPLFSTTGTSLALVNTFLRERSDTLMLNGKDLEIQTDWYTNGRYAGTQKTVLERRR